MDFLLHCIMRAKGVARKVHQGSFGAKAGKCLYLSEVWSTGIQLLEVSLIW